MEAFVLSHPSIVADQQPSQLAAAAAIAIVPQPNRLSVKPGSFALPVEGVIACSAGARDEAVFLAQALGGRYVVTDGVDAQDKATIRIALDETAPALLGSESYRLSVTPDRIEIAAAGRAGVFYALQTLLQLLPAAVYSDAAIPDKWEIPCVDIEDAPRFGWRGAMIDVGRYFMPVEFIKKLIDLLAIHKMNVLHLHLTEDQGWRLEIKKYPKLTEIGAYRKETLTRHLGPNHGSHLLPGNGEPHSGFYTQDEARDIVAYAAARHITVVPEIELPGHARAAIAAYPEFGCSDEPVEVGKSWGPHEDVFNPSEETFAFFEDVLREVMDIFPSTYIHIGGDEVIKDQWKASDFCQQRMRELGLKDEDELQAYFIGRMDRFLTAQGRRLIGWDEILEGGLAPNATVMSWRGEAGGIAAANAGHDVIMSPESSTYLDHYQSQDTASEPIAIGGYLPLSKAYAYEPIPSELPAESVHYVLGAQAQIWTEYMPTPRHVEYMAFPRMSALAEAMWTQSINKAWPGFQTRLSEHLKRLDVLDVKYRSPGLGE